MSVLKRLRVGRLVNNYSFKYQIYYRISLAKKKGTSVRKAQDKILGHVPKAKKAKKKLDMSVGASVKKTKDKGFDYGGRMFSADAWKADQICQKQLKSRENISKIKISDNFETNTGILTAEHEGTEGNAKKYYHEITVTVAATSGK